MRLVTVTPNPSIDRLYEVDRFVRDAVNRPVTETLVAGGKGFNVARAAIALGAEVRSVALLAGHAGRWMADRLAEERILGRWTWTDGETRSCFAIHEVRDGTVTELNEAGPLVGPATWSDLVTAFSAELTGGGVGVATISGSLPPGAPVDGLRQLASVGAALGVAVALDAGGEVLRLALDARPWLVKINAQEASATVDHAPGPGDDPATDPIDDEAAAIASGRALAARTGGAVIVTRGRAGAIAVGPDGQTYRVGRPDPAGSYPVGSGDAFLAAVTVATIDGRGFDAALRLGAAADIANAQVRGAGRLEPDEVARVGPGIVVEPIPG